MCSENFLISNLYSAVHQMSNFKSTTSQLTHKNLMLFGNLESDDVRSYHTKNNNYLQ